MPRGVRKSELEKLQEELASVRDAIKQYNEALKTKKEKEKNLIGMIEQEELKSVMKILEERGMSVDELKAFIEGTSSVEQQTA